MLARIALRHAAIEALKGKTLVGDNVLDSEIGALDVGADNSLRSDQERPFISVYVDGSKIEGPVEIRALHKSGPTEIMFESGITAAMTVTDEATGLSTVVPGMPSTDAAFEFFLDCVGRQIVNALSDPTDPWAEIWRGLMSRVLKIERRRISDAASGTRVAAHQLVITVDLLPDPLFGLPIKDGTPWAGFFAKLAAQALTDPLAATKLAQLRSLITSPAPRPQHEEERRRFGLTRGEAASMLLTPADTLGDADITLVSVESARAEPTP